MRSVSRAASFCGFDVLSCGNDVAGADPYGLIEDAALVQAAGKIAWVGPRNALPRDYADLAVQDMGGRLVTPALVDCHTHVVHGGNRATEFEMRLQRASYEQVARAEGGIVSTVTATRRRYRLSMR